MNQANRAMFEFTLAKHYENLYENDPDYAYSKSIRTPSELAYKMTLSLCKGDGNKDGKGIKGTCKDLGIKYTYKGIYDYLNAPNEETEQ
jgi:hypothetical protein